jgi:hypothetical protein
MTAKGYNKLCELYAEYESDLKISPFNIGEKTMMAPTFVSKWLLIRRQYKHELSIMTDELDKLKEEESKIIHKALKVAVTDDELKTIRMKFSDDVEELSAKIQDYKCIIEDLNDLVKAVGFYRNDIRNAIEYSKLENP